MERTAQQIDSLSGAFTWMMCGGLAISHVVSALSEFGDSVSTTPKGEILTNSLTKRQIVLAKSLLSVRNVDWSTAWSSKVISLETLVSASCASLRSSMNHTSASWLIRQHYVSEHPRWCGCCA